MEMILEMPFLSFSNVNLQFGTWKLTWKTYITTKIILIVDEVELIDKYEFAKTVFDKACKTFVVHVVVREISSGMTIYVSSANHVL